MEYIVITALVCLSAAGAAALLALPVFFGLRGKTVLTVYLNDGTCRAGYCEARLRSVHRLRNLFFKNAEVYIIDCGASEAECRIISLLAADFGFKRVNAEEAVSVLSTD